MKLPHLTVDSPFKFKIHERQLLVPTVCYLETLPCRDPAIEGSSSIEKTFFFFDLGFRRENFSVTGNFPSKLKPLLIGHKQEGNVIS